MSYSFEYIDIILLAMIAGFIFLRLRGILGKKSGFEEDINQSFPHEAPVVKTDVKLNANTFDDKAKKELKWEPKLSLQECVQLTSDWYLNFLSDGMVERITEEQIEFFESK